MVLSVAMAAQGGLPVLAQAVPFPVQEFQARDRIARALISYDACAWRSTDELLKQPRAALEQLGPVWLCLPQGDAWDAIYGQYAAAEDRYTVRFHFRVTDRDVALSTDPIDTTHLLAGARALAATAADFPAALSVTRLRFNTYVQFAGDSLLTVWVLPAWQQNGLAAFGAEVDDEYSSDGRVRRRRSVVPGPIRLAQPDTAVAFRLDSNSEGAPSVGDLFFLYLMRHQFARIRIQTARYSSSIMTVGAGEAWVHVVRDSTRQ
jgi:hypothetical protein